MWCVATRANRSSGPLIRTGTVGRFSTSLRGTKRRPPAVPVAAEKQGETTARSQKDNVFFDRYVAVAHSLQGTCCAGHFEVTVAELAELWDCSQRSARQSLTRLAEYGLIKW